MKKIILILLNKLKEIDNKYNISTKLKALWTKIWGTNPTPIEDFEAEHYKLLDEETKEKYWQEKELYNIQVFKLKKRRKLISGILSIIILIAGLHCI